MTRTSNFQDFAAEHDNRHRLRKEPNSRESNALMLLLPEHGLAGWVYPTVMSEGASRGTACVFGPGIESPIMEHIDGPVPEDMDFRNWQVGGLKMAIGKPHQSLDVSWRGAAINVDFHYEALHPVYAFSSAGDKGSPPYYGDDRTEQHGIVTGNLEVRGKRYDFKSFMPRDHSWGPRVWGLNQHYKWFHATTAGVSIHFFEMQSFGKTHLQGYLYKDGVMAHLDRVDYDFEFDDRMMQKAIDVVVHDDRGRSVVCRSVAYANIAFEPDPVIVLNEAATKVSIDGQSGVGWCEFCWNRSYLDYARKFGQFMNMARRPVA